VPRDGRSCLACSFAQVFLAVSSLDPPVRRGRQETARFPHAASATALTRPPSVSHILRRNARSRVRLNDRALNLN
jgi:hypothetical protein